MQEVAENVYRESVFSDCKAMQSAEVYLIRGRERSLLIDTGYCVPASSIILFSMLERFGVAPEDLDVFITHNHPDHAGLAWELSRRGAAVYLHPAERETCAVICGYYENSREVSRQTLRFYGHDEAAADQIIRRAMEEPYHYHAYHRRDFPFLPAAAGQRFSCAGYTLEAVALPGHTKHQLGLAERQQKWLFAGDALAKDQIFILSATKLGEHLLESQLATLEALKTHCGDYWIVPGHGDAFQGVAEPAESTARYFQKLSRRILAAVERRGEWVTVTELMTRLFAYRNGALLREEPLKLHFRMANTVACLDWLTGRGLLEQTETDGVHFWRAAE